MSTVASTVFVVGAGGSCHYGLPSAATLVGDALVLLDASHRPRRDLYARASDLPPEEARDLLLDLQQYGASSIDEWLDHRQGAPEVQRFGKTLIVALLGRHVAQQPEPPVSDWLRFLLDRLRPGATTPADFARVLQATRFVTFNFDTVIERAITACLERTYPARFHPDVSRVGLPKVLHMHGTLLEPVNTDSEEWLRAAAAKIHVVHDAVESADIQQARALLEGAKSICFLGFSYHPNNLRRLGITDLVLRRGDSMLEVFGSMYKVAPADRRRHIERLNRFNLIAGVTHFGPHDEDCMKFLHERHVLRS